MSKQPLFKTAAAQITRVGDTEAPAPGPALGGSHAVTATGGTR